MVYFKQRNCSTDVVIYLTEGQTRTRLNFFFCLLCYMVICFSTTSQLSWDLKLRMFNNGKFYENAQFFVEWVECGLYFETNRFDRRDITAAFGLKQNWCATFVRALWSNWIPWKVLASSGYYTVLYLFTKSLPQVCK